VSAVLLILLKIPDLTALTALDAGRALLPRGYELTRLVREEMILFEPAVHGGRRSESATVGTGSEPPAGSGGRPLDAAIEKAVETSNFFVNPNKERYRFIPSAERGEAWVPPEGSWGILARPRGDTRDAGLLERLQREHPLAGLGAIRKARVWWLWTRTPEGDSGMSGIDACLEALGPVERAGQGLLVNPHSESWLLLSGPTAWTRIETFLAEPAPEAASASTDT
jgi:hypothetical protein